MKILVISHTAVLEGYQKKFKEISENPELNITLLLPKLWKENYRDIEPYIDMNSNLKYAIGKIHWSGFEGRYFFIESILKTIRKLQPDLIHLEEEPWSLSAMQTILIRNIFSRNSKILFRTSRALDIYLKLKFVTRIFERFTFKNSIFAFCLSQRAVNLLKEKGYKGAMQVFPNGVDTDIFYKKESEIKEKLLNGFKGFIIGFIGRFLPGKGIHLLLKAVSGIDEDYRLLLVGGGPFKKEILNLMQSLKLESRVLIVDTVPLEEIPEYMNIIDTLVLPSCRTKTTEELFGRVIIEAMACEVPVIGSDLGEIPNVIGDDGLIFPENDVKALKNCILMLMNDPLLREEFGKRGKAKVEKLYSWKVISKNTEKVYLQAYQGKFDYENIS